MNEKMTLDLRSYLKDKFIFPFNIFRFFIEKKIDIDFAGNFDTLPNTIFRVDKKYRKLFQRIRIPYYDEPFTHFVESKYIKRMPKRKLKYSDFIKNE